MSTHTFNYWIDGHVHLYACFDLDALFDSAYKNLSAQAHKLHSENPVFVLFLVDAEQEKALLQLESYANDGNSKWHVESNEKAALLSRTLNNESQQLWCVFGQQLVTAEALEVLIVGQARQHYQPRVAIKQLIDKQNEALVLLPWGVGKWLGQRGNVIDGLAKHYLSNNNSPHNSPSNNRVFFSDIPSRSSLLKLLLGGRQLFLSARAQQRLINGTDPLPLKGEEITVGSFGSHLSITSETEQEQDAMKVLLSSTSSDHQKSNIKQFGQHQGLFATIVKQLKLLRSS